jgi:hypothetical protein
MSRTEPSPDRPLRLALVVQRYGDEVNGGAEYLARTNAERLIADPRVGSVHVLTTCARDHRTWAPHYPAGRSDLRGVTVERFENVRRLSTMGLGPVLRVAAQPVWFFLQGPFSLPLLRRLRQAHAAQEFDAYIFYTYLYATTVFGLPLVRDRAIMVPTAHDETAIHNATFRVLFRLPRAYGFLTPEERSFMERTFSISRIPSMILALRDVPGPDREPQGVRAPVRVVLAVQGAPRRDGVRGARSAHLPRLGAEAGGGWPRDRRPHPGAPRRRAPWLRVGRREGLRAGPQRGALHALVVREPVAGAPGGLGAGLPLAGRRPLRGDARPVRARQRRSALQRRGVLPGVPGGAAAVAAGGPRPRRVGAALRARDLRVAVVDRAVLVARQKHLTVRPLPWRRGASATPRAWSASRS